MIQRGWNNLIIFSASVSSSPRSALSSHSFPTCPEPQARLLDFGLRGNATPISGQWGFLF